MSVARSPPSAPAARTVGQYLLGASSAALGVLTAGVALVHLAAGVASAALVGAAAVALLAAAAVVTPAGRRALARVGVPFDRTRAIRTALGLVALAAADAALFVALGRLS